jgi:hypothetical protein
MKKLFTLICVCVLGFASASAQCTHTINLTDSYADGWSWAGITGSVDVVVDGIPVLTEITCTGAASTFTFEANTGSTIELANWVEDSYSSEYGWTVLDGSGSEIATGGAGETTVGGAYCPSCVPVNSIEIVNLGANSVDISWTAGGDETSWNIEYGLTDFSIGSGTSISSSSTSSSITGLNSNTSYQIYIQSDCGGGVLSDPAGPINITTYPEPGTCGYYEFNYVAGGYPSENSYTITNQNGDILAEEGAGTTTPGSVILGSNIGDVITVTLADSYGDGWNGGVLNVTYQGEEIGSYTIDGGGEAIFNITACPSCSDPTNLGVTDKTNSSASLSWTAGDDETTWNIEWDTTGFNLGEGNNSSVNSTTYDLTGLTPNTGYDFYVQADCGGGETSEWAGPFTFGTQCEDIASFPYFQDFENYLGCWNAIHNGDNTFWGYYNANGIGESAAVGLANASLHDDHLISPTFTVTDGVSDVFSIFANGFGAPEQFEILVSTSGIDTEDFTDTLITGITMQTAIGFPGVFEQTIVDLSDYEGQTINVSVHAYSDNIFYFLVDNALIAAHSASTTEETACDSYEWNGEVYEESGTYTFETSNSVGLDSIATLELTVNNSFDSIANETACDSFDWNGETYTSTGNYDFASTTAAGCDSTITLALTINNSSGNYQDYTACLTYDWYGSTYTESGTYYAEGVNDAGCILYDTIVLTISSDATTTTETVCDSYDWNGTTYTSSTTETFSGTCGDDVLNLTVNYSSSSSESLQACESYDWVDGNNYITSGTYTFVTENTAGCDSTMTLELEIGGPDEVDAELTVCDSLVWNGMTYYESGDYSDTLLNMYGCDSVVNVDLTVNSSSNEVVSVTECEADSYEWDGQTYTASGEYTNTYSAANGCDSIVTLSLTFNDPYAGAFVETLDDSRAALDAPATLPSCWEIDNTGLSTWTNSIDGITVLRFYGYESGPVSDFDDQGEYLYVQTYNFDAAAYAAHQDSSFISTKDVDLSSMSNPELNFNYQMNGLHMGHLSVWVNDDNGLTEIFTKSGDQGDLWLEESINLSDYSGTVNFVILSVTDTTGTDLTFVPESEMAIDNFEVRETPSCYDPYSLVLDTIDGSEATVSWMTNESITSWNYVSGETGFDPLSASASTIDASTVTLTGLEYATQYEFYVQSDCGTDWVGPLVINVPYPADYGCPHTVNMVDSWGDGWNGGSIDVLVNGSIVIAGGTIDDGAELSVEFGAEDGDDITITNFVPGSYVGEISFNVTDGGGNVIYSSGEAGDLNTSSVIDTTVTGVCPQNDITVEAGLVPSGCDLSATENIEIWITNLGVAAETGFTVSYAVNGGTAVNETVSESVEPGETLTHVFAATADMSAGGDYDVELSCGLSTDNNSSNDTLLVMGTNVLSPTIAPVTMGDSISAGDTATLSASSDNYIIWYDDMTEGNAVGYGETLMTMDTVSSNYYAAAHAEVTLIDEGFEGYTAGDLIAESSMSWEAWSGPNGGGADDAAVSDLEASEGFNSLLIDNAAGDDVILPFSEAFDNGIVTYAMDMNIETSGYFNFQTNPIPGTGWAFSVFFADGVVNITDEADTLFTGTYPGSDVWFNISLTLNIVEGITEVSMDTVSQGTFEFSSTLGAVNLYAAGNDKFYVDNVITTYAGESTCSSERSEAVVSVAGSNTNVNGIVNGNVSIYPNPNNGEFVVSNTSEIISITIKDVQGKTVRSMNNLNINKVNIGMTDLEKGMYLINIETGKGNIIKPVMVK